MMRATTLFAFLGLALAAGSVEAQRTVKTAEAKTAISVAGKKDVASVILARVRTTLTLNEPFGAREEGIFCRGRGSFIMGPKTWEAVSRGAARAFRAELTKAGYPNPFAPDSVFDDRPRGKADFEVGVMVRQINANLCLNGKDSQGGVYLETKWELYSNKARKVVFEAVTEGSYQNSAPEAMSFADWFDRAFAVAVRNLLAEKQFGDILTGDVPLPAPEIASAAAVAATAAADRITLPAPSRLNGGVPQNATLLRASVVTISSGRGNGSGFFVSPDGYLITSQHVVGDVKFVKVKLATGRELVGEVLKTDQRRDVALVKTEPIGATPLAIRITEPNIGEDLYAIGSPFSEQFSGSVTRGILSGYRTLKDQRYLQSDVTVLPGNSGGPLLDASGKVVGIVKGGVVTGMGNLNLFVPIGEAVSSLSLEVRE